MPFYDENLTQDDLKRMVDTHRCNECGNTLTVAWGGYFGINDYVLKCSNPEHGTIAPKRSAVKGEETYQEYIRREYQMEKELGQEKSRALATIPRTGHLTQSQAMHVLKLVYPQAPDGEIVRCAILCRDFGLHPLMKEVYIIPFGQGDKRTWSTVIGITANRKMAADRKGAYSFVDDSPRAASQKEIIKQFGEDSEEAEDNLISICKVRGKDGNEAIGFGLWPKDKAPYGMDKGNTKRNMTNIRAERQALDRLPGEPLPREFDVIDEAYTEAPEIRVFNEKTGEITEPETPPAPPKSNFTLIKEESSVAAPKEAVEPAPQKPKRDPATVKTLGDLYTACSQDFGLKARQVVWKELGVNDQSEITETPAECYARIAAVMSWSL